MKVLVLFALATAVFSQQFAEYQLDISSEQGSVDLFEQWAAKFSKKYASSEEKQHRYEVFKANIERVKQMNAIEEQQPFGLTQFSDLEPKEFKSLYLMDEALFEKSRESRRASIPVADLSKFDGQTIPSTFDWRNNSKALTKVKNQEQCGSCWAFSTTENIESVWSLQGGHELTELSVQQIVSCDHVDAGCNGGDLPTAFEYVIKAKGLETEKDYPYVSGNGVTHQCKDQFKKELANIDGWEYASKDQNETAMAVYLYNHAPISICVDAESWQHYSSGVVKRNCGKSLDHCVQLVGWTVKDGVDAWIVRNSWGASWGEQGYIYIERFSDLCGIAKEPASSYIRS